MDAAPPNRQISTRKGVALIVFVIAAISVISLVRHWAQAQPASGGIVMQTADGRQAVGIFTSDSCTYCAAAKQYLTEKAVAFKEFNLDHSDEARQVFGMLGGRGVPLIIVGDQRLVGFDPGMLGRVPAEQGFL